MGYECPVGPLCKQTTTSGRAPGLLGRIGVSKMTSSFWQREYLIIFLTQSSEYRVLFPCRTEGRDKAFLQGRGV